MSDGLSVVGGPEIPLAEIELKTSRSSGPGGQHANVTASRVEAVFDVASSTALRVSTSPRPRVIATDSATITPKTIRATLPSGTVRGSGIMKRAKIRISGEVTRISHSGRPHSGTIAFGIVNVTGRRRVP